MLTCPVIVTAKRSHKPGGDFSVALAKGLLKMFLFDYWVKHGFVVVKADTSENVRVLAFCYFNIIHVASLNLYVFKPVKLCKSLKLCCMISACYCKMLSDAKLCKLREKFAVFQVSVPEISM